MPSFPPKIGESKAPRMMCSSFEKTSPPPPVNQLPFAVILLHFLRLFTAGYAQATSGGACEIFGKCNGNSSHIGQWSEMMSLTWSGYIDPNSGNGDLHLSSFPYPTIVLPLPRPPTLIRSRYLRWTLRRSLVLIPLSSESSRSPSAYVSNPVLPS
jgi:hypothetical protein